MIRYFNRFFALFLCLFTAGMLFACGKNGDGALDCPFTELDWDNTAEEIIAAEGEEYSTYDSIYGGLCYTYPKEYEGHTGVIKYMFDEEDRLVSIAWTYNTESSEELAAVYEELNHAAIEAYGDSGKSAEGVGNYGNVWHLEGGDIILTTMSTSELSVLQYSYLHPLISSPEES